MCPSWHGNELHLGSTEALLFKEEQARLMRERYGDHPYLAKPGFVRQEDGSYPCDGVMLGARKRQQITEHARVRNAS
jgi:hypothetical protein